MHLEDLLAAHLIGGTHDDAPIEASRSQQRRVEDLRAVGGGEHDDALATREPVHLGENLIQRLLALVVATEA